MISRGKLPTVSPAVITRALDDSAAGDAAAATALVSEFALTPDAASTAPQTSSLRRRPLLRSQSLPAATLSVLAHDSFISAGRAASALSVSAATCAAVISWHADGLMAVHRAFARAVRHNSGSQTVSMMAPHSDAGALVEVAAEAITLRDYFGRAPHCRTSFCSRR